MSQGPNFRRVITEYSDPRGPGQFGAGDHMSGREPLEENRISLSGRDQITGRGKLGYLAHRPFTIDRLRHRHGEPTTQPNRKGTAEQPHITRIIPTMRYAIGAPCDRGYVRHAPNYKPNSTTPMHPTEFIIYSGSGNNAYCRTNVCQ